MPNLTTNLLRINFSQQCSTYLIHLMTEQPLQQSQLSEVQQHVELTLPNALYQHPYIYSPHVLQSNTSHMHLSNGLPLTITFQPTQEQPAAVTLVSLLAHRMVALTKLLYSTQLSAFFNPFLEEQLQNGEKSMPGWTVSGHSPTFINYNPPQINQPNQQYSQQQNQPTYISIAAVQLKMLPSQYLNEDSSVLLDHDSGQFLLRQKIVRVDKEQNRVYFRDGQQHRRSALLPVSLHALSGFPLAHHIHTLIARVKQTSSLLFQAWKVELSKRFQETAISFPAAGTLSFRDGIDYSLSHLISPMSASNYCYNYLKMFNEVRFDQILKSSLTILGDQQQQQLTVGFKHMLQKVALRMALEVTVRVVNYKNAQHMSELLGLMQNQNSHILQPYFYLILKNDSVTSSQKEQMNRAIQNLISTCQPIHLISYSSLILQPESLQMFSLQHLQLLYTKHRINPWKLKNLPFMTQPMMLLTLHIACTKNGSISVSIVGSMNVYFTKFTAIHKRCSHQQLSSIVCQSILQCQNTFFSKHQRHPQRLFLIHNNPSNYQLQLTAARQALLHINSSLTAVDLNNTHNIRTYTQHDSNYLAKDSTKRTQLTAITVFDTFSQNILEETYLQLEMETPPYRVSIQPVESGDPAFIQKVIELVNKVVSGGVGHKYGEGLGMVDYPRRLNEYRQYDLTGWSHQLREGVLMFL